MKTINTICICGAGTMGNGIAQVFAQHGFNTTLFDINEHILSKARETITYNLNHLIYKQKIALAEKENILSRIKFLRNINDCTADLIIEAIIEKIELKVNLFIQLAGINTAETIFATNTSSLSVYDMQKDILHPQRIAGMHFFNPAPIMKLVEVVKSSLTGNATIETLCELCKKIGKTPVVCHDVPGFIVNRVARQYYLEAMRLIEQGVATLEDVDAVMEATGFRMGPFKLMDMIGIDINLAVSQSIYEGLNKPSRLKPLSIQLEKVRKGELGRKSGKGFYEYNI